MENFESKLSTLHPSNNSLLFQQHNNSEPKLEIPVKNITEESSFDDVAGKFKHPLDLDEKDYEIEPLGPNERVPLTKNHTPLGSFVQLASNHDL